MKIKSNQKKIKFEVRMDVYTKKKLVNDARKKQGIENPNLSEHLRHLIHSDSKYYSPILTQQLNDYERELHRIGNNINQVTRYFHSGLFSEKDKQVLLGGLEKILKNQEDIKHILKGVD